MFKVKLLLLLLSSLCLNSYGDSPKINKIDITKMSIYTVDGHVLSLNTTYAEIIELFGVGKTDRMYGYDLVVRYDSFSVFYTKRYIYDQSKKALIAVAGDYIIKRIDITGSSMLLYKNITIGSSREELLLRFGTPYRQSDTEVVYLAYDISETWNLLAYFSDKNIKSITILRGD